MKIKEVIAITNETLNNGIVPYGSDEVFVDHQRSNLLEVYNMIWDAAHRGYNYVNLNFEHANEEEMQKVDLALGIYLYEFKVKRDGQIIKIGW